MDDSTQLVLDPVMPVWLIGISTIVAAAAIGYTLHRCLIRRAHLVGLLLLRLGGIIILAALLLQPALRSQHRRQSLPSLALLVDTSASMKDGPGTDPHERIKNLRSVVERAEFRSALKRFDARWYDFGTELREGQDAAVDKPVFTAPTTNLIESLNELHRRSRGLNLAGVVLFSDGLDHSNEPLSAEATRVPIYIPQLEEPAIAETETRIDTYIDSIDHPKVLILDWAGEVSVLIKRRSGPALVCPVHLYREAERIRTVFARFAEDEGIKQVKLSIHPPAVGRVAYRVAIEPPDDARTKNNERHFFIDVTDPENRLLYLEGLPRWEFKFFKRIVLKERNYHLSAFVRSANGQFLNLTEGGAPGALPKLTGAELLQYRALILGELPASAFTGEQQLAIAEYVEKGGSILFLGGTTSLGNAGWPAAEALRPLLPWTNEPNARIHEGRYAIAVSDRGRSHALMTDLEMDSEFPIVLSLWGPVKMKPGAVAVLEAADASPLLLVSRFGQGKVAAILTDSLWRWQLGGRNAGNARSHYERFYSQLIHWLSPEEKPMAEQDDLQILTHSGKADVHECVFVGAIMGQSRDEIEAPRLTCTVATPEHRRLTLPMQPRLLGADVGLSAPMSGWRAEFKPHVPGQYEITITNEVTGKSVRTLLLANEPRLELTGMPLNREFLISLAERTKGIFASADQVDAMMQRIPGTPIETYVTDEIPIWNSPWILALLILLFGAEWYCRARIDLV